jgi:V/A-type H+-transporting ATPase subunit A
VWGERRARALTLLSEADRLEATAQLVGAEALPDRERVTLLAAGLVREGVLQQSALSPNDTYCAPAKGRELLRLALDVGDRCLRLCDDGIPAAAIEAVDLSDVVRAREASGPEDAAGPAAVRQAALARLDGLAAAGRGGAAGEARP